jgi:hypothetical protein
MRRTADYNLLDYRNNENTLELKVHLVKKKLAQYKQKLLNHFSRMEDSRHPEQVFASRSIGGQRAG